MAAFKDLLSLIVFVVALAFFGLLGYAAYVVVNDVQGKTKAHLEKKNVSFSKEGVKVGVKGRTAEQEQDATANILTKTWTASGATVPPSQSRSSSFLGKSSGTTSGSESRKPFSRSSSSQQKASRS